jgi:hypothetical protein
MATKTKAKKTTTKTTPYISDTEKYNSIISLSDALVSEIDNVMSARLAPGQLGQILGTIVSSYKEQVDQIKRS